MQNPIEIDDGILDNILEDTTDENNDDLFNSMVKSTVESGECFGDFTQICEGTKFIPYYAVVESESVKMLHLSKKHVSNLVKKLETIKKFEGLIQFITSVIPSFSKMSSIARSRIGGCFKEKHYLPGTVLIKEGQPCDRMFLVMKGDVLLKSSKSPIQVAEQSSGKEKSHLSDFRSKKGYISDTINSYQIGIKFEKQWIGEESLILDQGVYLYSAIAKNKVSTLY